MPNSTGQQYNGPINIRAVILDYGEVLCYRPTSEAIGRMASIFQVEPDLFPERYARSRGLYDRGDLTPTDYWFKFAKDAGVEIDAEVVEKLRNWDVEMWSRIDVGMTEWLANVRSAGLSTALLSNMQLDMIKHVRKNFEWLNNFDHQIFSAEVRLIKPDLAIYQHCLQRLGVQPPEALFVDDRERNVRAARAVGITGIRFQSVEQLRGELEALGFTILPSDSSCQLGSQR